MKLTKFENRWAEAALGAIFPGTSDGFADIRAMDVAGFLREVFRLVPLQAALGIRVAIWVAALAPLFVLGRLATIVGLAVGDRESVVARLVTSRWYVVRSLVLILKTIGALLYAGDDNVRARMLVPARPKSGLVTLRAKPAA
jgi:hypothetical protein